GIGYSSAAGIALNTSSGSTYAFVTGQTQSIDFPVTAGVVQSAYGGSTDAFVTQLKADGSGLVYSTYLGGSNTDLGNGIAVDVNGYAYVAGSSSSADFPTTAGSYQTALAP